MSKPLTHVQLPIARNSSREEDRSKSLPSHSTAFLVTGAFPLIAATLSLAIVALPFTTATL
ncbi:hypothetical protein HanPSC8_Chr11g0491421 [Helianthus annuus]|nr:hypothetical protein HanPSC8_Chr11g0491421 [Helianthus annuus]